jgi:hypothetical protein
LLLGAAPFGCADPAPASFGRLGEQLSGADLDTVHTGVIALLTVTRQEIGLCSAALLTPNLALTARHCVAPTSADSVQCNTAPASFSAPYALRDLWVNHDDALGAALGTYGYLPTRGGGNEFVSVSQVFVPDGAAVCGNDVALVELGSALGSDQAIPLVPRLDRAVVTGEAYSAVGFGATPAAEDEGTRRSRSGLTVSCSALDCQTAADIEPNEFAGGEGVCSGDSGGPALDSDGRIIGVASRSTDCSNSIYSIVSDWAVLVRQVTRSALQDGGFDAPEWLEPPPDAGVPVPASAPADPAPEGDAPAGDAPAHEPSNPAPLGTADAGTSGNGSETVLPVAPASAPTDIERSPGAASTDSSGCSLRGAEAEGRSRFARPVLVGWVLAASLLRRARLRGPNPRVGAKKRAS